MSPTLSADLPLALGLTLAGGLCAGLYLLRHAGAPPSAGKSAVKLAATAALALAALAIGAPGSITAGLALGALGDLFLSRPGQRAFLAGMAAFALGHLAYAAGFRAAGAGLPGPGWIVALGALGLWGLWWLAPRAGALALAVRGYILVILGMAVLAAGLPGLALARAGAAAFVVSDLILALELFVLAEGACKRVAQRTLWGLYWGGQAAILWGMA